MSVIVLLCSGTQEASKSGGRGGTSTSLSCLGNRHNRKASLSLLGGIP